MSERPRREGRKTEQYSRSLSLSQTVTINHRRVRDDSDPALNIICKVCAHEALKWLVVF
jgi:hypothetical protein